MQLTGLVLVFTALTSITFFESSKACSETNNFNTTYLFDKIFKNKRSNWRILAYTANGPDSIFNIKMDPVCIIIGSQLKQKARRFDIKCLDEAGFSYTVDIFLDYSKFQSKKIKVATFKRFSNIQVIDTDFESYVALYECNKGLQGAIILVKYRSNFTLNTKDIEKSLKFSNITDTLIFSNPERNNSEFACPCSNFSLVQLNDPNIPISLSKIREKLFSKGRKMEKTEKIYKMACLIFIITGVAFLMLHFLTQKIYMVNKVEPKKVRKIRVLPKKTTGTPIK